VSCAALFALTMLLVQRLGAERTSRAPYAEGAS
jgi:hypothetical protein